MWASFWEWAAWFTLIDSERGDEHHVPASACAWVESQFCDDTPQQRRTNVRIFVALARKLRDIRRRAHGDAVKQHEAEEKARQESGE